MIATHGTYLGHPIILICDAKCNKAFGINGRPRIMLSGDEDDYVSLADDELGEAPADNGIYEGGHAKPRTPEQRHNKWCTRECERCKMVDEAQDFEYHDYSKHRMYNFAPHIRADNNGGDLRIEGEVTYPWAYGEPEN